MMEMIQAHASLLVAFAAGAVAEYMVGKYLVSPVAKVQAVATAMVAAIKAKPPVA